MVDGSDYSARITYRKAHIWVNPPYAALQEFNLCSRGVRDNRLFSANQMNPGTAKIIA
jgi:hypothetical protein